MRKLSSGNEKQIFAGISAADLPYLAFSFGVSVTSPSKAISISQCSGWIPIPKSCIS